MNEITAVEVTNGEISEVQRDEMIDTFNEYNEKRYGTPWVCKVTKDGQFDFDERVGTYTGQKGYSGDLVVFNPEVGQVYAYGQKDYRGHGSFYKFAKWNGSKFVPCNKLGKEK